MTDSELTNNIDKFYKLLKTEQTTPVTLYLDTLAESGRRSMRSLLVSAAAIFEFEGELERMPWSLLQYQHIVQIKTELQKYGKSANTINLTLAAIRGVMKACFNLGLINADKLMQINEVKRVREEKLPAGRSLTAKEIKALFSVCKKERTFTAKRDLAIIALMLATGLRRSEVVALKISHYNSRNGELLVMSGKGNKQRQVFINAQARKLIVPWLKLRGRDDGYLFNPASKYFEIECSNLSSQNIYDLLKKRSIDAGIKQCRPHDLRRTFVTRLLESGVDINTVRQLAGHSDIQTTARYDLRDERHQKKAMQSSTTF